MVRVSVDDAKKIGRELGIDFRKLSPTLFQKAMKIELEHGKKFSRTNITNNDLLITGKIALAHLLEYSNYYESLIEMEKELDKYWRGKKKKSVLKKKK